MRKKWNSSEGFFSTVINPDLGLATHAIAWFQLCRWGSLVTAGPGLMEAAVIVLRLSVAMLCGFSHFLNFINLELPDLSFLLGLVSSTVRRHPLTNRVVFYDKELYPPKTHCILTLFSQMCEDLENYNYSQINTAEIFLFCTKATN